MNGKPIALDICSRMGGATVGLQRAGFYVIAVDIEPQEGQPAQEFWQYDGIRLLQNLVKTGGFSRFNFRHRNPIRPALIWQSWPCQDGNTATASNRKRGIVDHHVQFIPQARILSDMIGIPYVIEQPQASRTDLIRRDLTLCMDMFKGSLPPPWVQKHRSFEISGFTVDQPEHPAGAFRGGSMSMFPPPAGHATRVRGHRHGTDYPGDYVAAYGDGGGKAKAWEIAHAMGIDWITWPAGNKRAEKAARFDLCEAIPPAYSEYIGRAFLSQT